MNTRRCQKIASRMNGLLKAELGQGVAPARMLADTRYARDVLLVCEAMRGSELAALAARYRRAMATEAEEPLKATASAAKPSSFLSSLFGAASDFGPSGPAPLLAAPRRWFGRARSTATAK